MLNSTKCMIKWLVCVLLMLIAGYAVFDTGGLKGKESSDSFIVLGVLVALAYAAGLFQGMGKGWMEIELRRMHPEEFEGERLEDD